MVDVLVTGGSGFFGGILKRSLLREGFRVTSMDRVPDASWHPRLTAVRGDLRDRGWVESVFRGGQFSAVFHCAAVLAHGVSLDRKDLWASNVEATRSLADAARRHGVRKLVFTSTNCLWASNLGRPVTEEDEPQPAEIYGYSKYAAEQALEEFRDDLDVTILRCPTIIDRGRLGLLAILFEFIHDNKTVWVVGEGGNRYQFIHAEDLTRACLLAMGAKGWEIFHVGSENVKPLREVYEAVIRAAGSRSRVRSLPKEPTLALMRLAHTLRISPLGPYHYRMIGEDFLFDTTRIRERLGWRPTLTNEEMLVRAYRYYASRREEIHARTDVSAHSKPTSMGVIRLLKWVS